ncbi:hypothetical protein [Paenibacillus amylolyticus]|uniref:hypothetical protein n=1 Tax=Paenibacillus amylolyticus TaxID=1451 RepID=UPI00158D120A|nr:hypothetical protein [Paenibacillus amylolyticus]
MAPLEKMTTEELVNTTQDDNLDYDIRIHASKEYLKRLGVISIDREIDQDTRRYSSS